MSDDHINGGGYQSPTKAERLEHAQIGGVHGKKVFIVNPDGEQVNVQSPLTVDGDSVYAKDIDLDHSTKVGWTGNIIDLFACPNDTLGMYLFMMDYQLLVGR